MGNEPAFLHPRVSSDKGRYVIKVLSPQLRKQGKANNNVTLGVSNHTIRKFWSSHV